MFVLAYAYSTPARFCMSVSKFKSDNSTGFATITSAQPLHAFMFVGANRLNCDQSTEALSCDIDHDRFGHRSVPTGSRSSGGTNVDALVLPRSLAWE
jgi:hypothetical protein